MTATLTKWYSDKGRHEIFAGGKSVNLDTNVHKLKLNAEDVAHGLQHDLDAVGIAKNAREEKTRARDEKLKQSAKDAEMGKLYRQHILKEAPAEGGFVPLGMLTKPKPAPVKNEEVGTFGD